MASSCGAAAQVDAAELACLFRPDAQLSTQVLHVVWPGASWNSGCAHACVVAAPVQRKLTEPKPFNLSSSRTSLRSQLRLDLKIWHFVVF